MIWCLLLLSLTRMSIFMLQTRRGAGVATAPVGHRLASHRRCTTYINSWTDESHFYSVQTVHTKGRQFGCKCTLWWVNNCNCSVWGQLVG